MNHKHTLIITNALATALTLPLGPANATNKSHPSSDRLTVGLVDGKSLIAFDLHKTSKPSAARKVSSLKKNTSLVKIDFRMQNELLYTISNKNSVYTLSTKAKTTKVSQLTITMSNTSFGIDFNPTADRLRVISDNGQNLRHDVNPSSTTITDGTLTTPPTTTPQAKINGATYTNNDLDTATATTLFDLDTTLNQMAIQAPANAGSLSPTGKLKINADSDAGFDITNKDNAEWTTLSVNNKYRLYSISPLDDAARLKSTFPSSVQVSDIAIPINK